MQNDFYPRSPRGERPVLSFLLSRTSKFLSTLPARGATEREELIQAYKAAFLSTLPARGATFIRALDAMRAEKFLSTLPARGATEIWWMIISVAWIFLSTLPARGATPWCKRPPALCQISIHAPREGSDLNRKAIILYRLHFYPRSPRGERPRKRFSRMQA